MSQNAAHLQVQVPGLPGSPSSWDREPALGAQSSRQGTETMDGKQEQERRKLLLASLLADITRGCRL